MRLASLRRGGPDGTLVVVSCDGRSCVAAEGIAGTLQTAMESWERCEPALRSLAESLDAGSACGAEPLDIGDLAAPLPRAWQWLDGSAYPSHGALMNAVLGISADAGGRPLMYQGLSDTFYPPLAEVPMADEAFGIDFEGEFGIIVDEVPMGVSAEAAARHIRLIVQINDWSLRALAGQEMKTGFGWVQAKPASGMAAFAITPDELGEAWANCRPGLNLSVDWNGRRFGDAHGAAMEFGFDQLIAHAARTRRLVAGTVIGSGTVSNENFREVGSSCIAERRGIEIVDNGEARTGFMRYGDSVRMEARLADGSAPFGFLEQTVVQP